MGSLRRKYWQYRLQYPVRRKPSDNCGLKYLPTIEPHLSDDSDFILGSRIPIEREVTQRNLDKLTELFHQKVDRCRLIMELGVCRNGEESFTWVFLNNKRDETKYLGVDIDDKSFLDDPRKKIHTIQTDTMNQELVRSKIKDLGEERIDILFIDGWHSVNATVNDWKYANLLAYDGLVFIHDTNCHPGPVCVFDAVDEGLFHKQKFFTNEPDWGLAVLQRIH